MCCTRSENNKCINVRLFSVPPRDTLGAVKRGEGNGSMAQIDFHHSFSSWQVPSIPVFELTRSFENVLKTRAEHARLFPSPEKKGKEVRSMRYQLRIAYSSTFSLQQHLLLCGGGKEGQEEEGSTEQTHLRLIFSSGKSCQREAKLSYLLPSIPHKKGLIFFKNELRFSLLREIQRYQLQIFFPPSTCPPPPLFFRRLQSGWACPRLFPPL